jgi:hypothetical protein
MLVLFPYKLILNFFLIFIVVIFSVLFCIAIYPLQVTTFFTLAGVAIHSVSLTTLISRAQYTKVRPTTTATISTLLQRAAT